MENYSILAYLISGVFFILALRGLSSPETARRGNIYGISGMVIAIITTLLLPGIESYGLIAIGILVGGIIGTSIALGMNNLNTDIDGVMIIPADMPYINSRDLINL